MTGISGSSWPDAVSYRRAIGSSDNYLLGRLRSFKPVKRKGMPVVAAGARAVVFKGRLQGRKAALRLFTVDPKDVGVRYSALAEHLSRYHCPPIVNPVWEGRAISIGGQEYPGVVMDWLDGFVLDRYLENEGSSPDVVTALAASWEQLASDLASAQIAHGDLQHGNIIVTRNGEIRLVDFDSVWVPGSLTAPPEAGLPSYQHPKRSKSDWGQDVDGFSILLIAASLRALAQGPDLWRYNSKTNLIFSEESLADPHHSIWAELLALDEPLPTYVNCLQQWLQRKAGWLRTAEVVRLFEVPSGSRVLQASAAGAARGESFDFWASGPSDLYLSSKRRRNRGKG